LSYTRELEARHATLRSGISKRSKRSPDGAKRNPGFPAPIDRSRISLRFIRATTLRPMRDKLGAAFDHEHGSL